MGILSVTVHSGSTKTTTVRNTIRVPQMFGIYEHTGRAASWISVAGRAPFCMCMQLEGGEAMGSGLVACSGISAPHLIIG